MDRTKREEIHSILRRCIKVDATGLAPAVIGHHILGYDDAVDALLPLLTTAEGEAHAKGLREGIEKAAKVAELYAEENLTMAGDTILADPVIRGRDFSDAAMEKSETLRIMGHGHSAAYHAGTDIAAHIRSLKDQGERG